MIGVGLDMLILAGMLAVLRDEEPEWVKIFVVALVLSLVNLGISLLLGGALGLLVLLPMAIVDGIIIMLMCGLTPKQAGLTVAALTTAKFILMLIVAYGLRVPDTKVEAASATPSILARHVSEGAQLTRTAIIDA